MSAYNIQMDKTTDTLKIGFGSPAQNDQIVRDAIARLEEMKVTGELMGGGVVKINGPASLPVAMVLAHAVAHLYCVVGVFDPKLGKYVVAISHDSVIRPGDLID